jgi:hypothetical protein
MAKSSHRLALAAGADVWLTAEEERIGGAHELVVLAVPALVRLRTPALLADAAPSRRPAVASWRSSRPARCACSTGRSPRTAATTAT